MKLSELLKGVDVIGKVSHDSEVEGICFNPGYAEKGFCYVDYHPSVPDDLQKAPKTFKAVERGATVVVCDKLPPIYFRRLGVTYVVVGDTNEALGIICRNYYGDPSRNFKLIGVTGTNGKTTTATLLYRMFRAMGYHVGLISTIVHKIDDEEVPARNTTPDSLEMNRLMSRMVEAGCEYVFMEVSSHGVALKRISGLTFAGGIFSNITHDHLDYHKTMANYIAAKKGFFDNLPKEAFALTNVDDRNGMVMVQNTKAKVYTYSLNKMADFRCKIVEDTFQGLQLEMDGREVWTRLVGRFNAYNLTAIYATAVICGVGQDDALRLLSGLSAADGRFQYVSGKGITAIVDYAHTPDALQNVLQTVNEIRRKSQMLYVVVGCGGDRDKTKRPEMAKIGCEMSDRLVLTSDNPRTEDPEQILDDMEAGLSAEEKSRVVRISDRRQAIKTAVMMAKEGDIVLVAGKGHEKYQDVCGEKHHFDDVEELQKLLNE